MELFSRRILLHEMCEMRHKVPVQHIAFNLGYVACCFPVWEYKRTEYVKMSFSKTSRNMVLLSVRMNKDDEFDNGFLLNNAMSAVVCRLYNLVFLFWKILRNEKENIDEDLYSKVKKKLKKRFTLAA